MIDTEERCLTEVMMGGLRNLSGFDVNILRNVFDIKEFDQCSVDENVVGRGVVKYLNCFDRLRR